jgi:L,D-transpeptidase YcbB
MRGRAVIVAAGTLLLSGVSSAQSPGPGTPPGQAGARAPATLAQSPVASEPDPLTPVEVQSPPPAAPMPAAAAAPVAATAAAAAPDPVVSAIRTRLAAAVTRQAAADPADRAALTAFYEADGARVLWTDAAGFTARGRLAMDEIAKAGDWGLKASAFELPSLPASGVSEEQRADAEIKLGIAILKYARHARGGRLNPPSISALLDRKPQVYDPKTLINAVAMAGAPDAYLRGLHPKHAGFVNLQKALIAARTPAVASVAEPEPAVAEPPPPQAKGGKRGNPATVKRTAAPTSAEAVQRIVVNMERWRWMPDDIGSFHVWNNIPDQMTTVYSDGKVVFTERIVVGAPVTPTPNFSADMQFVIFQPEWGVPGGIKNNEIGPMLRRASSEGGGWFGDSGRTPSSVLARHGLRVSNGSQMVNPDNIDWSKVDVNRFSFVQPAGPTNVLGVVKFRFPNKHDVYMHDTPQKHLFSAAQRAFSHGCMRVQNPVRFAEVLLEHDKGWASDRVRGMVPRGGEVKLSTQIPVHNVYFTAVADETGKIRTAADIYGVDSRMASALEGRSVAVASRGDPAAAGGPVPKGETAARQAKRRAPGSSTAGNSGLNIFSGLFGN